MKKLWVKETKSVENWEAAKIRRLRNFALRFFFFQRQKKFKRLMIFFSKTNDFLFYFFFFFFYSGCYSYPAKLFFSFKIGLLNFAG